MEIGIALLGEHAFMKHLFYFLEINFGLIELHHLIIEISTN